MISHSGTENTALKKAGIEVTHEKLCGLRIRAARRQVADDTRPPLLIFGGFGANLELQLPFMQALRDVRSIIFDLPGVGGSSRSLLPMSFRDLAELSAKLIRHFGFEVIDTLGMSWGGALAQEFAYRHPECCRRLVLVATCAGNWIMPARVSVLLKLANPRRYWDPDYLKSIAGEIYGGRLQDDPQLVDEYIRLLRPLRSPLDYFWQLYASTGWSSLHWLRQLRQPTLILAGTCDPILPLQNAKLLHEHITHSHLVELDDGHLLLFTSRDEAASLIRRFLALDNPAHFQPTAPLTRASGAT